MTSKTALHNLKANLTGHVLEPGDPGYDEGRTLFYTGFDRRPLAIARVESTDDVSRVVSFARDNGVDLTVRGGGHSTAGYGAVDGAIVLDLSGMKGIEVDVPGRVAWAETGLTAGEYTEAVGAHGLVTGFGDAPSVGIGGITLGGGVGFLHRKLGLTMDSLIGAEIVLADGSVHRIDAENSPDLFWAIRGGGGNFGVVTRLGFRLHELGTVLGGMLVLPATPQVIARLVSLSEEAPDELSTIVNVMTAPPMPFLPEEVHGRPVVMVMMVYAGDVAAGEQVVMPFREVGSPLMDMIRPMAYPDIYDTGGEEMPHPVAMSVRTMFVDAVDENGGAAILEHLTTSSAPMRVAQIRVLGGAVARVPNDATAYAHRHRRIMVNVAAAYEDRSESEAHETWVDRFAAAVHNGEPGAYVNFLGAEGEARVREAYPGSTYSRLQEVKGHYDPGNLFRHNQNIQPEAVTLSESA